MAVATFQDVGVSLGRTITDPAEQAQITHWLNGVELFIKNRLGPIASLDQDTVKYVETEVAAEKARRLAAGGASSETVTVEDGTVTRRFESVRATDITDDLWALFGSAYGSSAYTVAVTSPLDLP